MRIVLLGPVKARSDDGTPVDIGGVRLRMLLARLALEAGRPVSVESLIDGLWGEEPPAEAGNALQALVSRLRKALRGAGTVDPGPGGYRLSVRNEDVDAFQFEGLAAQGRRELAAGRPQQAASVLGTALELWQGEALADVLEAPFARLAASRLEEIRAGAIEDRFDAELQSGRHTEVLADLEAAFAEHPLSERLAGLRMRALAAAGRQSDALAVYEDVRGRLSEELGVDPSADLQETHLALLRGELYRPEGRPEPAPARLPAQLTSFVGRNEELDQLAELLASSRLVTVVGPGGAGKTRLSLEAAPRDQAYRRGRVWFVPLAGVSDPDQLPEAVLGALGSSGGRFYDGKQDQAAAPVGQVAELLDVGDAVLILDNCEHLVEAAAELADQLLHQLPRLRILATSREPLAIAGEALCRLGPLKVPSGDPAPALAGEASAVRLFVERAASVRPGFVLDDSTVGPVVEICWRLDGMPLALELAAAKLRSMSVDQVARRLYDRFRLLTSGSRTALPRQRTLLALVEWSWDLLDEPERLLARRLSFFPGGATLSALEAVCAAGSLPAEDVLYVVGALVEKSLVEVTGDDEPRYRMLETVRAYAAARLVDSGDDVSERFADHYLVLAEEQAPQLRTREQLRAMALFDAEHDNMLFALRKTVEAGEVFKASQFVRALFWYWGNRGLHSHVETYMAELSKFGDALPGEARDALKMMRLAGYGSAEAQEIHPARLLWIAQRSTSQAGEATEDRFQQALNSTDPWVRASAHWAHNFTLVEQGDLLTGADAGREALRGFEAVGDRWGLVMALLAVGRLPSLRGEFNRSIAVFERAVAISSELGTEEYLYWTRTRLARERMRGGDLDGARSDIDAMRRRAEERGLRRNAATILFSVANLHRRAGDFQQAEQTLDRMEALVPQLPYPEEMARDLIAGTRMMNRLSAGEAAQARELLPRAVRPNVARGQSNGLAWAAEQVGELLALEDDTEGAATALGMSQAIRGAFDEGEPVLRRLVADLHKRLGEDAYREAYDRGAEMTRPDALNRLAELSGQPVSPQEG